MAFRSLTQVGLPWIAAIAFSLCCLHQANASDPNPALRWMASQPFRYGGAISGGTSGHMFLAFGHPGVDGRVHGEAMMLKLDRHLIGMGTVDGDWKAWSVPGGHVCTLTITLPKQILDIDAICSAETLSGEFTSQDDSKNWLTRQIFWWPTRQLGGQTWMTKSAFYD